MENSARKTFLKLNINSRINQEETTKEGIIGTIEEEINTTIEILVSREMITQTIGMIGTIGTIGMIGTIEMIEMIETIEARETIETELPIPKEETTIEIEI